jgi:uncharacterized membrane protein YbhN (UPF0104 family)
MNKSSEKRWYRHAALRLAGTALVLTLLFTLIPVSELFVRMRRVPFGTWLLVLACYMSTHIVGVIKWRMMVNLAGAGLPFAQGARCYFAGLFGSLFLPSIIGGDVVRLGLALRLGRNRAGVLLGSLLDRMLDVVALTCVAAFGTLLLPGALDPRGRMVFWGCLRAWAWRWWHR